MPWGGQNRGEFPAIGSSGAFKRVRWLKSSVFPTCWGLSGLPGRICLVGGTFRWWVAAMRDGGFLRSWWRPVMRLCGFGSMPNLCTIAICGTQAGNLCKNNKEVRGVTDCNCGFTGIAKLARVSNNRPTNRPEIVNSRSGNFPRINRGRGRSLRNFAALKRDV